MPTYKIIASQIGNDAGPFTIKNNLGQVIATGVTRLQLLNGYTFNVTAGVTSVTATSTGNCTNEVTLPITNEGYWEMEKSGVEQVKDHYGIISNAYTSPVESFVAKDVVGIYGGILSGTGNWLIKGGPEDITGTVYNGGGVLIVTNVNTISGTTTVENGAIFQLGYDTDSYKGSIAGTLNVLAGGVVNILGANETARVPFQALTTNFGIINFKGAQRCGEGNFRNAGVWDNRNLVTIEDAKFTFNNPTTFGSFSGIIQVLDGGTLSNGGVAIPATQTLKLNGCGKCNATGLEEGAFLVSGSVTISSPIEIETESCMKVAGNASATFSGSVTGSSRIILDNAEGTITRAGSFVFNNNVANFNGTLELRSTTLLDGAQNTWANADLVMERNSAINTTTPKIYGSLSSTDSSATITANGQFGAHITLADNGITTYAGALNNSTPANLVNLTVNGGTANQLTLSNTTGGWYALIAKDGSQITLNGGTYGTMLAENGGTISAGKSLTSQTGTAYGGTAGITINSGILEVQAITSSQAGLLTSAGPFNSTGTLTVDLVDPLVAGTYNILKVNPSSGTGFGKIPTIGVNNTGLTPTFSWSGQFLRVTLA